MTTARARSNRTARPAPPVRRHSPPVPGRNRLSWWAAALPAAAFALLLTLLLGGSGASAAQQQADPGGEVIAAVLERVAQALLG